MTIHGGGSSLVLGPYTFCFENGCADGPPPEPEAWLGVLASHDGTVDSYGVEMSVTNLAASPERASARITVTAAGGEQLASDRLRMKREPGTLAAVPCPGVEWPAWSS